MKTLVNCPFCGESKTLSVERELAREAESGSTIWRVHCGNKDCGAVGPKAESAEGAVEKWNRTYRWPPVEAKTEFFTPRGTKVEFTLRGGMGVSDTEYASQLGDLIDSIEKHETAVLKYIGQVSNQGRVRSDSLAPLEEDGLLFRSQPEVFLYQALKSLGVTFAPLPTFLHGGGTYRRVEPDFVLIANGVMMIVEIDGSTTHREAPVDAHERLSMFTREGVFVERVRADRCATLEAANGCARDLIRIIEKLRLIRPVRT